MHSRSTVLLDRFLSWDRAVLVVTWGLGAKFANCSGVARGLVVVERGLWSGRHLVHYHLRVLWFSFYWLGFQLALSFCLPQRGLA
jgi:hypothetical protein